MTVFISSLDLGIAVSLTGSQPFLGRACREVCKPECRDKWHRACFTKCRGRKCRKICKPVCRQHCITTCAMKCNK